MNKYPVLLAIFICIFIVFQNGVFPQNLSALTTRKVINNERGFYYVFPYNDQWSKVGAYIGLAHYDSFEAMNKEAIRGIQGRFQHFHSQDENKYAYFPYAELKEYETDELNQNHPPLWITAKYKNQKKPVIFEWLSKEKAQGVNFADERYINFFIKKYVRNKLQKNSYQNIWLGLDNCAFNYNLYGVFDEKNNFINNVKWEKPFPQNNQEFLQSVKHFFKRIKGIAPDIKIICNEGSIADETQYNQIFANTDGVILEDFLGEIYNQDGNYARDKIYQIYLRMKNFATNKVQIYQPHTHNRDELIHDMYLGYLIFGGENRFLSMDNDQSQEIDPKRYIKIKNALGNATFPATDQQEINKSKGYRLYSRTYEGGIIYFNLTGKTQTIKLKSWQKYFDEDHLPVTSIVLKDKTAKYVVFSPEVRAEKPVISPVKEGIISGEIVVNIQSQIPNATIRYTLDNSEPNQNSPIYRTPIKLTKSAMVKAKVFSPNGSPSWTSNTYYSMTNKLPQVEFHVSAASGSEFLNMDYPLVKLNYMSGKNVTVNYAVVGGTAKNDGIDYKLGNGQLTFQSGEQYKYLPIPIINDDQKEDNETIKIKLYQPINAKLGNKNLYTYTIKDND
ncbi:MAG: FN3 associated domain-containing protein [Dolichospermum sp.]